MICNFLNEALQQILIIIKRNFNHTLHSYLLI